MKKHLLSLCLLLLTSSILLSQEYWSKRFDIEMGNEYGSQVIVRDDGFLVFMRGFCGLNNAKFCYGIIKFDLAGEKQWQALMYDTIGPESYQPMAIRNDTIFVNVQYKTIQACSVLSYDLQGNYLGRYDYFHPSVVGRFISRKLKSSGERLFVNFSYDDTLDTKNKDKIRAYDPSWHQLWEVKVPDHVDYPRLLDVDMDACPDGGIITISARRKTYDERVCIIHKFDADGIIEWDRMLDGMYEEWSYPVTIHAHPDGGYMGHWQIGTGDFWSYEYPDMWFKLDANGQIEWQRIDEAVHNMRNFTSTFVAQNGDLIGCGRGEDSPYDTIDEPDPYYCHIARIKPDGEFRWERRIFEKKDGGYWPELYHGAEMPNGDLIFTGVVWDTIQTPENPSWDDLWLLKLDSNGCLEPGCDFNQYILPVSEPALSVPLDVFRAFPNPFVTQFSLAAVLGKHIPSGDYRMVLYDAAGRVVIQQDFNPHLLTRVETLQLPSGLYSLVIFRDGLEFQALKMVKP